jgi:hypothetical protein
MFLQNVGIYLQVHIALQHRENKTDIFMAMRTSNLIYLACIILKVCENIL